MMLKKDPVLEVRQVVAPPLASCGLAPCAVEILNGPSPTLRIYIEKTVSPDLVSIEDCVNATHLLNPILDMSPVIDRVFSQNYTLEVSSPGVERLLQCASDFSRFLGQSVKIKLHCPLENDHKRPRRKTYTGILKDVKEDEIVIVVELASEGPVVIPLPLIAKAHLHPQDRDESSKPKEHKNS